MNSTVVSRLQRTLSKHLKADNQRDKWLKQLENASLRLQGIGHQCSCQDRCRRCHIILLLGQSVERIADDRQAELTEQTNDDVPREMGAAQ